MTVGFLKNRAGVAALLTVAWAVWIVNATNAYPYRHVFHHDVDSPVIALEISRGEGDIEAVLHRSDSSGLQNAAKTSMAKVNKLDLVFIPLYVFSIWSLARVFANSTKLLTIVLVLVAIFDYIEDFQIYRALNGENPAIYIPSLVKWGLLGLVFIGLGRILLKSASAVYTLSTRLLMAIGYFVSGTLILIDVAFGPVIGYSHIALAMSVFSLLLIVNVAGLLGHYLAIPGIKQTFVENFCEERKKTGGDSLTAVKGEPAE